MHKTVQAFIASLTPNMGANKRRYFYWWILTYCSVGDWGAHALESELKGLALESNQPQPLDFILFCSAKKWITSAKRQDLLRKLLASLGTENSSLNDKSLEYQLELAGMVHGTDVPIDRLERIFEHALNKIPATGNFNELAQSMCHFGPFLKGSDVQRFLGLVADTGNNQCLNKTLFSVRPSVSHEERAPLYKRCLLAACKKIERGDSRYGEYICEMMRYEMLDEETAAAVAKAAPKIPEDGGAQIAHYLLSHGYLTIKKTTETSTDPVR